MLKAVLALLLLLVPALPVHAEEPFVVVVDAGHGGKDPGAIGITGRAEKTVTLAVAQRVAQALGEAPGVVAVLTRSDDRFLSLGQRLDLVASLEADLLISLHADSLPQRPEVQGASVYTRSTAPSSAEAARKARRENAEDLRLEPLVAVSDERLQAMLTGLMRTFAAERSGRIARRLVDELAMVAPMLRRPHLSADFVVLRSLQTPSVLVELGYLSNRDDERRLGVSSYLDSLATAIASAVLDARGIAVEARNADRYAGIETVPAARIELSASKERPTRKKEGRPEAP